MKLYVPEFMNDLDKIVANPTDPLSFFGTAVLSFDDGRMIYYQFPCPLPNGAFLLNGTLRTQGLVFEHLKGKPTDLDCVTQVWPAEVRRLDHIVRRYKDGKNKDDLQFQAELNGWNPYDQKSFPFVDRTNPLSEVASLREIKHEGREHLLLEEVKLNLTHRGRVCPLETPDDKPGHTLSLARGSRLKGGRISPSQNHLFGYSCALIPFIQHNKPLRAIIGGKSLRQALPLKKPEIPLVLSGVEREVAELSGRIRRAKAPGHVVKVEEYERLRPGFIWVRESSGSIRKYPLAGYTHVHSEVFEGGCYWEQPQVKEGDQVEAGSVLAEGCGVKDQHLALGVNLLVAYMPWEGYNIEDGIVISKRLVTEDHLTSIHVYEERIPWNTRLAVKEGDRVAFGTPVNDDSPPIRFKRRIKGTIIRTFPQGTETKIWILEKRRVEVGDKLIGRHGNKGVISRIVPEEEMPYFYIEPPNATREKRQVDIILNPTGVISRVNLGQILESHYGWVIKESHRRKDKDLSRYREDLDQLKQAGVSFETPDLTKLQVRLEATGLDNYGRAVLVRQVNGKEERLGCYMVGYQYFVKLGHLVRDKLKVIGRATAHQRNPITQQPEEGHRLGEWGMWALVGHRAYHLLQELMTVRSDDPRGAQALTTLDTPLQVTYPESLQILRQYLRGLGFEMEFRLEKRGEFSVENVLAVRLRLVTPEDGKRWEGAEQVKVIHLPESLLKPSPKPSPRGDTVLISGEYELVDKEGKRVGGPYRFIEGEPFPNDADIPSDSAYRLIPLEHPLFKPRPLTRRPGGKVLISGEYELVDKEGKGKRIGGPYRFTREDQLPANPDSKVRYRWIPRKARPIVQIESVPQIPPRYRWLSPWQEEPELNTLYRDLERQVNPTKPKKLSKGSVVEALEALFIRGKQIRIHGKQIDHRGILEYLKGQEGLFRKGLIKKACDFSGSGIIVPDPTLKLNQIGLPEAMARELVNPFLPDETRKGTSGEERRAALQRWLKEQGVLVLAVRHPMLHKYSALAFEPCLRSDFAIGLPPLLCTGFGADFDGDPMHIFLPVSREAREEAKRLLPIANLRSIAKEGLMLHLTQDFVLGAGAEAETGSVRFNNSPRETLKRQFEEIASEDEILKRQEELLRWATCSGVTFSIFEVQELAKFFERHGSIDDLRAEFLKPDSPLRQNSLCRTVIWEARGKFHQLREMAGWVRRSPDKPTIDSSFFKGLSREEYFSYAFLAREILYQAAKAPEEAGELFRKMIEAACDLTIQGSDCDTSLPRSPLNCGAPANGICKKCYGLDRFTEKYLVEGLPVGVLAAQSVGERLYQEALKVIHVDPETAELPKLHKRYQQILASKKSSVGEVLSEHCKLLDMDPHLSVLLRAVVRRERCLSFRKRASDVKRRGWMAAASFGDPESVLRKLGKGKNKEIVDYLKSLKSRILLGQNPEQLKGSEDHAREVPSSHAGDQASWTSLPSGCQPEQKPRHSPERMQLVYSVFVLEENPKGVIRGIPPKRRGKDEPQESIDEFCRSILETYGQDFLKLHHRPLVRVGLTPKLNRGLIPATKSHRSDWLKGKRILLSNGLELPLGDLFIESKPGPKKGDAEIERMWEFIKNNPSLSPYALALEYFKTKDSRRPTSNERELDADRKRFEKLRDQWQAEAVVYRLEGAVVKFALVLDLSNYWTFPRGKIEQGEQPENAAEREAKEELWKGRNIDLRLRNQLPEMKLPDKRVTRFLLETQEEELDPEYSSGIRAAQWFTHQEIDTIPHYLDNEEIFNADIESLWKMTKP